MITTITAVHALEILCGVLGLALAWALFSRYAWKARALGLYERLTIQIEDSVEAGGSIAVERRTTPRNVQKKPSGSVTEMLPAQMSEDEDSSPHRKTG